MINAGSLELTVKVDQSPTRRVADRNPIGCVWRLFDCRQAAYRPSRIPHFLGEPFAPCRLFLFSSTHVGGQLRGGTHCTLEYGARSFTRLAVPAIVVEGPCRSTALPVSLSHRAPPSIPSRAYCATHALHPDALLP